MIETHRLKNVVIFIQAILSFSYMFLKIAVSVGKPNEIIETVINRQFPCSHSHL